MITRRFIPILAGLLACALGARPAHASFHIMQIEQIQGGVNGDVTAQAIQLRQRTGGQNVVSQSRIKAWDAAGANPVLIKDLTTNVTNGAVGDRVLITSAAFQTYVNPVRTPDFTMTNLIPPAYLAAGSLTFEDDFGTIYWRVSWGGALYTGPGSLNGTNDVDGNANPPFGGPLPSGSLQALRFPGAAGAGSTNNAADYFITPGASTWTNNAHLSETVVNGPVGVDPSPPSRLGIELGNPKPNPARTSISYAISLPHASHVLVTVFDAGGQRVRTLMDRELPAGRRDYTWDVRDERGARVKSGAYYVKLVTEGVERSRKVMVIQ